MTSCQRFARVEGTFARRAGRIDRLMPACHRVDVCEPTCRRMKGCRASGTNPQLDWRLTRYDQVITQRGVLDPVPAAWRHKSDAGQQVRRYLGRACRIGRQPRRCSVGGASAAVPHLRANTCW